MSNLIEYPEIPTSRDAYSATTATLEDIKDKLSKKELVDALRLCDEEIRKAIANGEYSCIVVLFGLCGEYGGNENFRSTCYRVLGEMVACFMRSRGYTVSFDKEKYTVTIYWAKSY